MRARSSSSSDREGKLWDGRRRRKWAHGNLARVRRDPRRMQHCHSAKTISAKTGAQCTTQAQTDDKQFPAGQIIKRAFGRTEKVQKQKN